MRGSWNRSNRWGTPGRWGSSAQSWDSARSWKEWQCPRCEATNWSTQPNCRKCRSTVVERDEGQDETDFDKSTVILLVLRREYTTTTEEEHRQEANRTKTLGEQNNNTCGRTGERTESLSPAQSAFRGRDTLAGETHGTTGGRAGSKSRRHGHGFGDTGRKRAGVGHCKSRGRRYLLSAKRVKEISMQADEITALLKKRKCKPEQARDK